MGGVFGGTARLGDGVAAAVPRARWSRLGAYGDRQLWRTQAHLIGDLAFGVTWSTLVVTALALAGGLSFTLIGLPLLALTMLAARPLNAFERARARRLLGIDLATPFRAPPATSWRAAARPLRDISAWRPALRCLLSDDAAWRTFAYAVVLLPWGCFTFVVLVTTWLLAILGTTAPAWGWAFPAATGGQDLTGGARSAHLAAEFVTGALAVACLPSIVRGLGAVDRRLGRALLGTNDRRALTARVEQLRESRDASVEGSASELRRIERNLHDGAQQRLVALAIDLGLARDRIERGADADQVAALVAQAHEEAKSAVIELRDLVRGIHPSVLSELGLDAALSALAARCPVPVVVRSRVASRLPPPIESAAYFLVAEALTNVAKHAHADAAHVRLHERAGVLVVEVGDDGWGGAAFTTGGGLAGLQDRVAAVEGHLRVASPRGGPTLLVAELPLAAAEGAG
ncbi:MAG: histidine kinase [Acidimicrobiales bacterium]|nr:histidine kinase [Acidimicrobiales bacterium]